MLEAQMIASVKMEKICFEKDQSFFRFVNEDYFEDFEKSTKELIQDTKSWHTLHGAYGQQN